MLISSEKVSDIILSNGVGMSEVVDISEWIKSGDKYAMTFVIQDGVSYFQGTVYKEYTKSDDGYFKKGDKESTKVKFSHEDQDNIELERVEKACVKKDGKRVIVYQ
jgi:hypothetical protein